MFAKSKLEKKQCLGCQMCATAERRWGSAQAFSPAAFFKESSCLLVCSSTVMCQLTVNNKCNIGLSAACAL